MAKEVPALNRIAKLGQLFDANSDQFCDGSIFTVEDISKIQGLTSLTEKPSTVLTYVDSDSFTNKLDSLNITAELKVAILGGLINVSGSGKYLSENRESKRAVHCTMIVNVLSFDQSLNINNEDLRNYISLNCLDDENATHYVGKIDWGGKAILTVKHTNKECKSSTEVRGALKGKLSCMKVAIDGVLDGEFMDGGDLSESEFSFDLKGDVTIDTSPHNIAGAQALMATIPKKLLEPNAGRGQPVTYFLYPVKRLERLIPLSASIDRHIISIQMETIDAVVDLFQEVLSLKQDIYDISQDICENSTFSAIMPNTDKTNLKLLDKKVSRLQQNSRNQLGNACYEVRQGNMTVETLGEELLDLKTDLEHYRNDAEKFKIFYEKLKLVTHAESFIGEGRMKYIGNNDPSWELRLPDAQDSFILTFTYDLVNANKQKWFESMNIIKNSFGKSNDATANASVSAFLVDLDIVKFPSNTSILEQNRIAIHHWRRNNSCYVTHDLLKDRRKEMKESFVHFSIPPTPVSSSLPNKRSALAIPCPGCCCVYDYHENKAEQVDDAIHEWKCNSCKMPVEYGGPNNAYFYCKCGRTEKTADVSSIGFKCSSISHGTLFLKYNPDRLDYVLKKMEENQLNILIIGQTGVGKSTFLNALVNYSQANSLKDMISNKIIPQYMIHSKFYITDDHGEMVCVETGELSEKEKNIQGGQSVTQECCTYVFHHHNYTIRFIDTPGIGDTRGPIHDQQNMNSIMEYLSSFRTIHAFMFVVKPNEERLNAMFEYCFKGLLSTLHKSASENIIFVHTNSRPVYYKAAATSLRLDEMLHTIKDMSEVEISRNKNTEYFFDSDAFRLLAAHNVGITFEQSVINDFDGSWRHSKGEFNRLFCHIKGLQAHDVRNSLSIHQIRAIYSKLSEPVCQFTTQIIQNKKTLEIENSFLSEKELSINDLERRKFITTSQRETRTLAYPRTVCTDVKCSERATTEDGNIYISYNKPCHSRCGLPPTYNSPGHAILIRCACFRPWNTESALCKCGHNYSTHMHSNLEYFTKLVQVEDKAVIDAIKENLSAKEMQEMILKNTKDRIENLELSKKKIEEAMTYLVIFLIQNCILPFNDSLVVYLDTLIANYEHAPSNSAKKMLEELQEWKRRHMDSRIKFLEMQETPTDIISLEGAKKHIEDLYRIPEFGMKLQMVMNELENAEVNSLRETRAAPANQNVLARGLHAVGRGIHAVGRGMRAVGNITN